MINSDKRVLEHFNNLLDRTKDKEKITVNRQNIVYLVNKLEKYFEQAERVEELEDLSEHHLKMLKYCSDARKKYHRQNKRYREAVDKIIKAIPIRYKNELELSTSIIKIADIVNDLKLEELE